MGIEILPITIESLQADMLATLEELVKRESPSTDKAAADGYAEALAARFDNLGAKTALIYNQKNGAQL